MKVNFDIDIGKTDIKLDESEKNDLSSIFSSIGLILGSMLYESNFDIEQLDFIEVSRSINQMLEIAISIYKYKWREYERQEI